MIAVILILFWTLFALSSVSVQYASTTINLNVGTEEIVEAGGFRKGACVLFEGKKKSIEKIYNHAKENENFAYLRILNIETKFPNKFVVHVAEREELFAVKHNGKFLICDRDLRVLKISDDFLSTKENPILLTGLEIKDENFVVGDFLNVGQTSVMKFYDAMLRNNRSLIEQRGKFEKIQLSTYKDSTTQKTYISMTLESFASRKFVINNIDFAFANKIQKMFAAESALFGQKTDENGNITNSKGEILFVVKNENGEYIPFDASLHEEEKKMALTYQILERCILKVDNFTLSDYINRNENDIFYSLVDKDFLT